jgi:hypothetical protein
VIASACSPHPNWRALKPSISPSVGQITTMIARNPDYITNTDLSSSEADQPRLIARDPHVSEDPVAAIFLRLDAIPS